MAGAILTSSLPPLVVGSWIIDEHRVEIREREMIKRTLIITTSLFLTLAAAAQNTAAPAVTPSRTYSGLAIPGGFTAPEGILDEFWRDPAMARELQLSDGQKKQLEDAALSQRLSLIGVGADALKALTLLDSVLKAEQFDEAAYKQHIRDLSAAAGRAVQELGDMAVTPRRILTPDQWTKLQEMRTARRASRVPLTAR
jgi:Spy/CpxP family protein refolding chaperone